MIALLPDNKREFERAKAEDISLSQFILDAWPVVVPRRPFVPGRHIDAIALHLEAITNGEITRLLVNMPPRHAKSTIISVLWPVWSWIKYPSHRWLCASYALSLAIRDNVTCRRLILSPWFQARYGHIFTLARDQKTKIKFENSRQGYRQAVSVGSSTTGEGGDTLLVDDPHAIDEKESDVVRESALAWFQDTWYTRLNDPQTSAMVVVGQRIHSKDVSGFILDGETGEDWTHLNLATEFEAHAPCITPIWRDWRKDEGELLWPDRFNRAYLDRARRRHGSIGYAALYQQRPVPAEGGTFKQGWLRYCEDAGDHYVLEKPDGQVERVMKSVCTKFGTGDLAISAKQTADYTVFAIWAVTRKRELLLIDVVRAHMDNPEQQQQAMLLYHKHGLAYFLIETVAYQLALVQQLRQRGLPIREFKPVKDKVARATTAAVQYEAGMVYHLKGASWLVDYERELLQFPLGDHDDQVDNASMACEEQATPDPMEEIRGRLAIREARRQEAMHAVI